MQKREINLRPAVPSDEDDILIWRNDYDTRKYSYNKAEVTPEEHTDPLINEPIENLKEGENAWTAVRKTDEELATEYGHKLLKAKQQQCLVITQAAEAETKALLAGIGVDLEIFTAQLFLKLMGSVVRLYPSIVDVQLQIVMEANDAKAKQKYALIDSATTVEEVNEITW